MEIVINFITKSLLTFIGVSLLVCLGPIIGVILSYIAPEELKPGKKNIEFLRDFLFLTIIGLFLYFNFGIFFALPCVLILFPLIYSVRNMKYYDAVSYTSLAIILILSYEKNLAIMASLIFLHGVIVSINYAANFEKNQKIAKKFIVVLFQTIRKFCYFAAIIAIFWIFFLIKNQL